MSQGPGSSNAHSSTVPGDHIARTLQLAQTVYTKRPAELQFLLEKRRIDLTDLSNVDPSRLFANKDVLSEFLLPYLAQGKVSHVLGNLVSSQMSPQEVLQAREDAIQIVSLLPPPPPSLSQRNRGDISYYISWTQRIILYDPSSTDLFV